MKKSLITYLVGIVALTLVIGGALVLASLLYSFMLPSPTIGIIIFLLLSTSVVHIAFMASSKQGGELSVSLLMASILGHMVVNIIFILALLYFNQEEAMTITFIFFGSFILYMVYEVVMISLFINGKTSE